MPAGYAAVIEAVASYAGSQSAAGAAQSASQAQANAADNAIQAQAMATRGIKQDLAPFLAGGTAANDELLNRLGLANPTGEGGGDHRISTADTQDPAFKAIADQFYAPYGGFAAAQQAGSAFQKLPPDQQAAINQQATSAYNATKAGSQANDPNHGSLLKQFTGADLENSPGYQFTLQQGMQGITNKAAAGGLPGGPLSGAAAQEAIKFNQGLAGTTFNTAFNQDMAQKQFTLGSLSGVSGAGQNAAVQQGGFAQAGAMNAGNLMTQQGNAQASGIVGAANATSQGINNAIGTYQNAQTLRSVFGGGATNDPYQFTSPQVGGADGMGGLG